MTISETKKFERHTFRKLRDEISLNQREKVEKNVKLYIDLFIKEYKNIGYIAIYWPLRNEVDIRSLKEKFSIALPRCKDKKELLFYPWDKEPLSKDSEGILSPNNSYTRPTTLRVREAIFNILKNRVENSNWLDLFSGTGAMSCEAYNHGASKIIAIEKNKSNSKICLENLLSLENIDNRRNDIEVICKDVLKWTKPNYERNLSSRNMDLNKLKFDFVYLDPPYDVDFHELVLNQLFNCNFLKKDSIVIFEHSTNLLIKKSTLWETIDVRNYGQSRLTFLINVQHP